ncbi:hypothetical protein NMG60_11006581 [Bertholletia excelsa]
MNKLSQLFCSLAVTSILGFFIFRSPNQFRVHLAPDNSLDQESITFQQQNGYGTAFGHKPHVRASNCNLFEGHWVPNLKGSLYTNWSCPTIPESKNCFNNGREDVDFVNWRWKPEECDLPRFNPRAFLKIVRGKTMSFVGDSVSRNHADSLLCLLSQEETPTLLYKDQEDRFQTWYFPLHTFTLKILWSKFLVMAKEKVINGSNSGTFDLHLDKVDEQWANELPNTNYLVVSNAHWFFRKLYLHQRNSIVGCVFCDELHVPKVGVGSALRQSFRVALHHVVRCIECEGMVTLVRTFSPAHFENGTWDTGGRCPRISPLGEGEVELGGFEMELRRNQVEEVERANKEAMGRGKRFKALDVTRMMLMRADGHPGSHWGNKWMKGYDDCVHWCLPGPIDSWNDLLVAVLEEEVDLSLD